MTNRPSLPLRKLLRAICMTACDLSACTKPWEIQLEIVKVIYQEFYAEVSDSGTQYNTDSSVLVADDLYCCFSAPRTAKK